MFCLVGCGGLLPKQEPLDIYRLPQTAASASSAAAVDWQLRVDTPQAPRMLSGARIAVVPDASRISVYQGARWAGGVPQMLRDRLIDAFHDDGRIAAISSDDDDLAADYELGGSLGAFQSEYRGGNAPVAVIRLDAWLTRPGAGRALAAHRFEVAEPADGTDVPSVVAAFGRAADKLSADVVAWTFAQAAAHPRKTSH
jgi:cholesterol transport system auxiliary component